MIQEKVFVLFALMAATLCVTQGKGNEACSDNIALSINRDTALLVNQLINMVQWLRVSLSSSWTNSLCVYFCHSMSGAEIFHFIYKFLRFGIFKCVLFQLHQIYRTVIFSWGLMSCYLYEVIYPSRILQYTI